MLIKLNGQEIESIGNFKYLGTMMLPSETNIYTQKKSSLQNDSYPAFRDTVNLSRMQKISNLSFNANVQLRELDYY